jgi:hypothetical protein
MHNVSKLIGMRLRLVLLMIEVVRAHIIEISNYLNFVFKSYYEN